MTCTQLALASEGPAAAGIAPIAIIGASGIFNAL